ncbi:MAG: ABC transporter ATP-binding protein [Oscillospiraceae bacterium]|jgi:lipopolysaccharide transport system ATP-binding protein|nr:ABC transporter ATP-binding protein [Oscillospiraceae bacterium]
MQEQPMAIRTENLGKCYRIKAPTAKIDTLAGGGAAARLRQLAQRSKKQDFWALRDVNIEIRKGESVGIIGKNGAGKSTLLKLFSRITEPTTGRIAITGRLSAMLEVGTGFNGELTGRENIYLNGAILGMTRAEVDRKYDSIYEFSEIGKFIDTPVKRYSSGMFVRLGFAVAAHLQPDIMVVDEVLAVGDAKFQKKCLEQMASVVESGNTVLFVSHQMPTIRQLCNRVILLKDGEVVYDGETDEGIRRYLMEGGGLERDIDLSNMARMGHISGEVLMTRLELLETNDCVYEPEATVVFRVTLRCLLSAQNATMRFELANARGPVGMAFSEVFAPELTAGETYQVTMAFSGHTLAPGSYQASISIGSGNNYDGIFTFDGLYPAFAFEILARKRGDLRENWRDIWGSQHLPTPVAKSFERV